MSTPTRRSQRLRNLLHTSTHQPSQPAFGPVEEGMMMESWIACSDPMRPFRERHDQASRLLWLAKAHIDDIRGSVMAENVVAVADWWLAEHHVQTSRQRFTARQAFSQDLGALKPGSGPTPDLCSLSIASYVKVANDVLYPMTEDVRQQTNAAMVTQLWTELNAMLS